MYPRQTIRTSIGAKLAVRNVPIINLVKQGGKRAATKQSLVLNFEVISCCKLKAKIKFFKISCTFVNILQIADISMAMHFCHGSNSFCGIQSIYCQQYVPNIDEN